MLRIEGAVSRPLSFTLDDLRSRFQAYTVETSYANEVRVAKATYTGARLWDILQSVGNVLDTKHSENIRVNATGVDGFHCTVEWNEFNPSGDNKLILVAYLQNGSPIESKYGPLRLVVPGDSQGLRHIGNLTTLTIMNTPAKDA